MKRKSMKVAIAAALMSLAVAGVAFAGYWQHDGRGWQYHYTEEAIHKGWLQLGRDWYYLNDGGYCLENTTATINGKSYVFDHSGRMMDKGWNQVGDGWYYMDANGAKITGWQCINGWWFYLDPWKDGKMATGWTNVNNQWYFMYDSGNMAANTWLTDNGKQYYLKADGSMATGWLTLNGQQYLFTNSGEWIPNTDHAQQERVTVTEELLYNAVLEDMTWNEIEALSEKFYTSFGATPASCIEKLNLARKEARLSNLNFSSKLTKAAYALCIAQRAWDFEGQLDDSSTVPVEWEMALDIHDAKSLAVGISMVRGNTLDEAMNQAIGTVTGLETVNNPNATTCGVGFTKTSVGDYIAVIIVGRTTN